MYYQFALTWERLCHDSETKPSSNLEKSYQNNILFRKFLHDLHVESQRAGCSIPNVVRVLLALRASKS